MYIATNAHPYNKAPTKIDDTSNYEYDSIFRTKATALVFTVFSNYVNVEGTKHIFYFRAVHSFTQCWG